jgi:ATP-dependent Lon protease
VGPREFAAGLDESHFGLAPAKELVSDFFANLIWRYRDFSEADALDWHRTGSAFLFVGPPGVGKTSLAISIAKNLGIPFHKVSLGGMRDEAALRGHGFTYEGSKPGAVVQGLTAMAAMNGMFILDEADKTEPFAIATLLEILDPEQNHLFHDKYLQTTVDVDLSNCHFILTANTLDTVPPPVIDRCQVVHLGRYSVEEKVEIARRHIIPRLRRLHDIPEDLITLEADDAPALLRFLIQNYTHEAGVRQLELVLRTLLLRLQRREVFENGRDQVAITRQLIKASLDEPGLPSGMNPDDRVGEVLALGVNAERGIGAVIPVQATRVPATRRDGSSAISMVHATGNLEKVMDESRRVATTAILHCAPELGLDPEAIDEPVHLHIMGGSTPKDGPSAGAAIALAITSLLTGDAIRRDVAVTGELDTQGRITGIGGLDVKLETAVNAGCKTLIIPRDNLTGPGGIDRLPEPVRRELQVLDYASWAAAEHPSDPESQLIQVVAVDRLAQALAVATVDEDSITRLTEACIDHARTFAADRRDHQPCPMVLVVKDREDLDAEHFDHDLCSRCAGCRLLVPRGSEEALLPAELGAEPTAVQSFDAGPDGLRSAVTSAERDSSDGVVLMAPFFALREAELVDRHDMRVVASNFDRDGRKLKDLKPWIHRLVCRMAHLGDGAFESFPLLAKRDGVWVADLSAVVEKNRLDAGRSREIFCRAAQAWLRALDGQRGSGH